MGSVAPCVVVFCCLVLGIVCSPGSPGCVPIYHNLDIVISSSRFAASTLGGDFIKTLPPACEEVIIPGVRYRYDINFEANFREYPGSRRCNVRVVWKLTNGGWFAYLTNTYCSQPGVLYG